MHILSNYISIFILTLPFQYIWHWHALRIDYDYHSRWLSRTDNAESYQLVSFIAMQLLDMSRSHACYTHWKCGMWCVGCVCVMKMDKKSYKCRYVGTMHFNLNPKHRSDASVVQFEVYQVEMYQVAVASIIPLPIYGRHCQHEGWNVC